MAEAELPRHADKQLDQAGLHAALLVEQAMSALPTEPLRLRFAPLVGYAAELRDASGEFFGVGLWPGWVMSAGQFLLWASVGLSIYSGWRYARAHWRVVVRSGQS